MAYLPPLNGGRINASFAGNTAGASSASAVSTGTVVFAGGNNVTLSQTTGANGATISFNAASQSIQTLGMYGVGNTTQNTSTALDARSVSLNGLGAMTVGYSNGSVQLSAPAISSVLASGIINMSTNGNTVSIGAPAFSAGMSTLGNTSGAPGTVSNQIIFAGGNNITLSQSTGVGGNTLNVVGPAMMDVGVSNLGNAVGQTGSNTNGMVLIGGSNVTLSQATNSNGASVSINAGGGVALYDGTSSISSGTARISAAGALTASISAQTLNLSVPATSSLIGTNGVTISSTSNSIYVGGGGGVGGGVALYDGTSSISSGTARISAAGALTASISAQTLNLSVPATSQLTYTGAVSISTGGGTITIGAPANGTVSNWEPIPLQNASMSSAQAGQKSAMFMKLTPQAYVSASQLMELVSISMASVNSTHRATISLAAGIYTANGSTLSLITQSSGTASYSWSNSSTNNAGIINGLRGITIPMNVNMSPGNYWLGVWSSTTFANTSAAVPFNMMLQFSPTGTYSGYLGQASNATQGIQEGVGVYTNTVNALPSSAAMASIVQASLSAVSAPYIVFKNKTW